MILDIVSKETKIYADQVRSSPNMGSVFVLGSFALAEHLARSHAGAPFGDWQPHDIDLFIVTQPKLRNCLQLTNTNVSASTAVAMWNELGLQVSFENGEGDVLILPARLGVVQVRTKIREHMEAGMSPTSSNDGYPLGYPRLARSDGEYPENMMMKPIINLEVLLTRNLAPSVAGSGDLRDEMLGAASLEESAYVEPPFHDGGLLPKFSFIEYDPFTLNGPLSSDAEKHQVMNEICDGFDLNICKFGMHPPSSYGGGGGSRSWEMWSDDKAAASAQKGVMHLCPISLARKESTRLRIKKYAARGFRLARPKSAKQTRLLKNMGFVVRHKDEAAENF